MAKVIENGDGSDPLSITNGVKQGCIITPTSFRLLFAEMLSAALAKTSDGITIHYRTDGHFFNLWRLEVNTKVHEALVHSFLFADDCALATHSKEKGVWPHMCIRIRPTVPPEAPRTSLWLHDGQL